MAAPPPPTPRQPAAQADPSARLEELISNSTRLQELSDSEYEDMSDDEEAPRGVVRGMEDTEMDPNLPKPPPLFANYPPIIDDLQTKTSHDQNETASICQRFQTLNPYKFKLNSHGIPSLLRWPHVDYFVEGLGEYPEPFVAMDASRPWIPYWSLCGISMLCDADAVGDYVDQLIDTLRPFQNPTGGFGGGHGQTSHIVGSYASVLSLVIMGVKDAYNLIDRKAMWQWLGRMKQKDGGFTVCDGGEEDVRGAYCAMVIISLLNLPVELPPDSPARVKGDETFMTNLPEWISRCQTFEGGIGGAPTNEAHGAYAFCALACLCIMGKPYEIIPKYLDLPSLISWLSSRQLAPEGGFAGRVNKLVDGCYSQWVGGCWAFVEAAVHGPTTPDQKKPPTNLWNREGLTRYILCCAQGKRGGLRDKPEKHVDGYHSCYNLTGLSAAQYRYVYNPTKAHADDIQEPLSAGFNWEAHDLDASEIIFDTTEDGGDAVGKINPVFVVPWGRAEEARQYYQSLEGF